MWSQRQWLECLQAKNWWPQPEAGRGKEGCYPVSEEAWPYWHLYFEFLAFRKKAEHTFVMLSHPVWYFITRALGHENNLFYAEVVCWQWHRDSIAGRWGTIGLHFGWRAPRRCRPRCTHCSGQCPSRKHLAGASSHSAATQSSGLGEGRWSSGPKSTAYFGQTMLLSWAKWGALPWNFLPCVAQV